MNGCNNLEEYKRKIGDGGDSSTGLMHVDINEMYPDAPVLIIIKTHEEFLRCYDWVQENMGGIPAASLTNMLPSIDKQNGMRIQQSEIFNELPIIWEYLIGTPYKKEYGLIAELDIQRKLETIDYKAAEQLTRELYG
jgi:hypothetical protein